MAMEEGGFNFINDIDNNKDSLEIKVRIIRLWKQPCNVSNQPCHIGMVLMDEKGERIHAAVKKQLIPTFEPLLEQGLSVVITKFGVAENGGQYPILKHPFKLNFYRHTIVKRCPDFQGSLYGFCFVPFPDILNFDVDANQYVDVIGNVVSCGNLGVYNTRNGKELKRLTFELQDLQGKVVSGTLWDGLAQELSDFVNAHDKEDYVIMIIQLARIHEWKGTRTIHNAPLVSRLFINEDIQEIVDFQKRLIMSNGQDSSPRKLSRLSSHPIITLRDDVHNNGQDSSAINSIQLSSKTICSIRDDFLFYTQRKYINEISQLKKESACVVMGTIISIEHEFDSYHLECIKCSKNKVRKSQVAYLGDIDVTDEDGDTLICRKCKTIQPEFVPRFKVTMKVKDCTECASFVLLDSDVTKMSFSTNAHICETHQKLIGKRFLFKIEISEYNITTGWNVYTILKMCDDDSIIQEMIQNDVVKVVEADVDVETMKNDESNRDSLDTKDGNGDWLPLSDADPNNPSSSVGKRERDVLAAESSTNTKLTKLKIENP